MDRDDYVQFAAGLIPGYGKQIVGAWETLNSADPEVMRKVADGLDSPDISKLKVGPLGGLLFGEPERFMTDLALQLRLKASYRQLIAAAGKDRNLKDAFGRFLDSLEKWQKRHGYENYWGFKSFGSWPELMKILDEINSPAVNAVLDFEIQAKTPFAQIREEFYRMETFTPQFIKAMKSMQRQMQSK